ncbi:MATE family efflux transporter [Allohahella marinimesophila]|uniref:Multidrug export protein MepA n=1 Tax=Allohahella marinimesophila TaxID=1054972 RepID=A0ABP7NX29_9GAMM
MTSSPSDSRALGGPILSTFFYFVIPSIVGLLAITTASIVDGIFVGNYVGAEALAAVTLMIPFFTLLFGLALMLAVGGSVRAGKYFGEDDNEAASAIFSKCLIAIVAFGISLTSVSLLFEEQIFTLLGAPPELFALMSPYFRIVAVAMPIQLASVVLYYFIRAEGRPVHATSALVTGSLANIMLNALFVAYLGYGLAGAAWATLLAQSIQLAVMLAYFTVPVRRLRFQFVRHGWRELGSAAYNGVSEFINEISAGLVILLINWLMMLKLGVDGVAAFTVVNYLIFLSMMVFYGIADAMHLLVSQNYGAGKLQRIRRFMMAGLCAILLLSGLLISLLFTAGDLLVDMFLEDSAVAAAELARSFFFILWPLFPVNGVNVLISAYLTAMHLPLASATVAFSRSLVLPITLLLCFYWWLPDQPILLALPVAEWLTFLLAGALYLRFRPRRLVPVKPAPALAEAA